MSFNLLLCRHTNSNEPMSTRHSSVAHRSLLALNWKGLSEWKNCKERIFMQLLYYCCHSFQLKVVVSIRGLGEGGGGLQIFVFKPACKNDYEELRQGGERIM